MAVFRPFYAVVDCTRRAGADADDIVVAGDCIIFRGGASLAFR